MRLWEEIQQDMQKQAEQRREKRARKIAHAFCCRPGQHRLPLKGHAKRQ